MKFETKCKKAITYFESHPRDFFTAEREYFTVAGETFWAKLDTFEETVKVFNICELNEIGLKVGSFKV